MTINHSIRYSTGYLTISGGRVNSVSRDCQTNRTENRVGYFGNRLGSCSTTRTPTIPRRRILSVRWFVIQGRSSNHFRVGRHGYRPDQSLSRSPHLVGNRKIHCRLVDFRNQTLRRASSNSQKPRLNCYRLPGYRCRNAAGSAIHYRNSLNRVRGCRLGRVRGYRLGRDRGYRPDCIRGFGHR